ncbi:MAG: 16S rRNA (guanine(966)-N(2))-methyltransferase RsmD, partial [Alphaproteobacteria bacterium]|nr:16S rRNA (guanine(966)-N(2))-methyltransferase RsmD [Alphaproteobacteria bacterium]
MRIAAGKYRGRHLAAPHGAATRPTRARVREAVFDILTHWTGTELAGANVLDVFAGAGAMGLEALSRGAARAVFIEQGQAACDAIAKNVAALGVAAETRIVRADATAPPAGGAAATLVFLDPPYRKGLEAAALEALASNGWIAAGATIIVEHDKGDRVGGGGGGGG